VTIERGERRDEHTLHADGEINRQAPRADGPGLAALGDQVKGTPNRLSVGQQEQDSADDAAFQDQLQVEVVDV